jgi:predicted secreted protein
MSSTVTWYFIWFIVVFALSLDATDELREAIRRRTDKAALRKAKLDMLVILCALAAVSVLVGFVLGVIHCQEAIR